MARRRGRSADLLTMLDSWTLALESANRSPGTIRSYSDTVNLYLRYARQHGNPTAVDEVTADHVRAFQAATLQGCQCCGLKANSAGNADKHHRNLKAFFNWLIKEGERAAAHPMVNVDRPTVPDVPPEVLTDDELRALLKECSGTSLDDRRDTAIMRVFMDTGMRVSSLAGLRYSTDPEESDVSLGKKLLTIRKKGGDIIQVPIGKKAARDLDRYIRARARHRDADMGWLWLGKQGRLQVSGVQQMLTRRGERARVEHVYPHRFRHTMADDWLEAGGNPHDLMRIAGWSSLSMVGRYGRAAADRRAWAAHAKLSPGDRI